MRRVLRDINVTSETFQRKQIFSAIALGEGILPLVLSGWCNYYGPNGKLVQHLNKKEVCRIILC
jgi:hypothetical protein